MFCSFLDVQSALFVLFLLHLKKINTCFNKNSHTHIIYSYTMCIYPAYGDPTLAAYQATAVVFIVSIFGIVFIVCMIFRSFCTRGTTTRLFIYIYIYIYIYITPTAALTNTPTSGGPPNKAESAITLNPRINHIQPMSKQQKTTTKATTRVVVHI